MVCEMKIYVVKQGDTVNSIAEAEYTTPASIIYNNQLVYPYALAIGQALLLYEEDVEISDKRQGVFNGYAYPFISNWVLDQTLPYLSALSIFSYGFTKDGTLIPPIIDETRMIGRARNQNALPILVLTPFGADGQFNNTLISAVVNNETASNNLLYALRTTMEEKGYGGLDIDFEYILAEDRDAFTGFVKKTTDYMNGYGYQVSVALAPKTSLEQKGLLYEGKDYAGLGAVANNVLLMTYEWGYTYGPPMAVAPINLVRKVVDFAVTQIPVKKINLGIPNYGYDWRLPFVKGESKAVTTGNIEAVQLAVSHGVEIQFDETAQAPYFRYWKNDGEHEVWFEDVRSIQAKLDLIEEYGLRGAGYWQIMQLFRGNWLLVADRFQIQKTNNQL